MDFAACLSSIISARSRTAAKIKEVYNMPRRNHPKHSISFHNFDVVEIYEPDRADVRKFISMPRKTIFINRAAPTDARVIRVGWSVCDDLRRLPFDE